MKPLNWIAYQALQAESTLLRFLNLPFGMPILCLGRKAHEDG